MLFVHCRFEKKAWTKKIKLLLACLRLQLWKNWLYWKVETIEMKGITLSNLWSKHVSLEKCFSKSVSAIYHLNKVKTIRPAFEIKIVHFIEIQQIYYFNWPTKREVSPFKESFHNRKTHLNKTKEQFLYQDWREREKVKKI